MQIGWPTNCMQALIKNFVHVYNMIINIVSNFTLTFRAVKFPHRLGKNKPSRRDLSCLFMIKPLNLRKGQRTKQRNRILVDLISKIWDTSNWKTEKLTVRLDWILIFPIFLKKSGLAHTWCILFPFVDWWWVRVNNNNDVLITNIYEYCLIVSF